MGDTEHGLDDAGVTLRPAYSDTHRVQRMDVSDLTLAIGEVADNALVALPTAAIVAVASIVALGAVAGFLMFEWFVLHHPNDANAVITLFVGTGLPVLMNFLIQLHIARQKIRKRANG